MQNSLSFFLFNHSSSFSPGWFFPTQPDFFPPCYTPAACCFIDIKSSFLESCSLFYRGTQLRNTSAPDFHGAWISEAKPRSVSLLGAHSHGSKSLLRNLPPKSTVGPLPAQIQGPFLELPAATRQLWTDNCKRQLHFLVSSVGSGGPGEDTEDSLILMKGPRVL